MANRKIYREQAGTTKILTWTSSGITPTTLYAALYTGSDTLVNSITMIESGSGLGTYYAPITMPTSLGQYYTEMVATIAGYPYIVRDFVTVIKDDSD